MRLSPSILFVFSSMLLAAAGQTLKTEALNVQSQKVKKSAPECKNLADVLNARAQTQLERANVRLTAETEPKLAALVNNAADTLASGTNEQCQEAKENFSRFVAELIKNAPAPPGPHSKSVEPPGEVTAEAFNNARISLCPLWPFC